MEKVYTFKQINNKIIKMEQQLKELKEQRQKLCSHENIEEKHYCDDDYAQHKTYTTYYHCKDCGLVGASNDYWQEKFKMLESLYQKNKYENLRKDKII